MQKVGFLKSTGDLIILELDKRYQPTGKRYIYNEENKNKKKEKSVVKKEDN